MQDTRLDIERQRKPSLSDALQKLYARAEKANIADELDDKHLEKIGATVKDDYELDDLSRDEWKKSAEKAMDVALQVRKPKNYPFEGASNVKYPLVTVAALQFGARAMPAILDGPNIVKGVPLGNDEGVPLEQPQMPPEAMQPSEMQGMPPEQQEQQWQVPPGAKRDKADRIARHMSYQLLYEMEDWEEDTDVLLHHLPIVGCAFRKVWRDGRLGRNRARMVPALRLVVNQNVESLDDAQRVTDVVPFYPQEIEERVRAGEWLDVDLPQHAEDDDDLDAPHEFLEQHRYIDLDGDGYREPYIVTVHKETCKVVRVVANYRPDEIEHDGKQILRIPKRQYFIKYSFLRDPKGGFYDIGFGFLLESLSHTIDSLLNQMLDAGHLQVAGGGFIGSGLRLKKDQIRFRPGKYQYVEAAGSTIRDAIYNMEHPGPTAVHFNLLELLLSATKDITGVKDILTGDTGGKVQQPTTVLAMVEQGLKVFTSIYKRVWTSLRKEYKLLFILNSEYLQDQEYFTFLDSSEAVAREDYNPDTIDVVPVSDPRMATDMQRSARAEFLMGMLQHPLINQEEALHRIFSAVGEPNIEALIQQPQADPMAEMQAQLMMADAQAEIGKKQAAAKKDDATAEATLADIEGEYRKDQAQAAKLVHDAEIGERQIAKDEALAVHQINQPREAAGGK